MSKKVIEQIKVVKYFGKGEKEPTVIDNPSARELTTVAKAICLEYQKVIDHNNFLEVENARLTKVYQKAVNKTHGLNATNAKLVEALEEAKKDMEWMWENLSKPHTSDHFNIPANAINAIELALQNNKKIEG